MIGDKIIETADTLQASQIDALAIEKATDRAWATTGLEDEGILAVAADQDISA